MRKEKAMFFYTSPIACVIIALMLSSHALSVFSSKLSRIFTYVNIALHISISPVLLIGGAELSELCFVYMLSLFALVLFVYIKSLISKSDERGEEERNDL